ncbi:MAG TPA: hemerythrin domain-containing protein [Kofleriaceae bacterium]
MPPTIHQYLSQDHARLDALLAQAIADPHRIDDAAYNEFRAGLLRHIAMEEKVLFTDARVRNDAAVAHVIEILHADHAAIASLLVPSPTHALIATLQSVLHEHNPLEELPGGFYEQCDHAAGDSVSTVIARMQAIAPVRASKHVDEARIHDHIERMLAARKHVR